MSQSLFADNAYAVFSLRKRSVDIVMRLRFLILDQYFLNLGRPDPCEELPAAAVYFIAMRCFKNQTNANRLGAHADWKYVVHTHFRMDVIEAPVTSEAHSSCGRALVVVSAVPSDW